MMPCILEASVPYFHRVQAQSGDSASKLLQRYHLNDQACNFSQFLKINNWDKATRIKTYNEVLLSEGLRTEDIINSKERKSKK